MDIMKALSEGEAKQERPRRTKLNLTVEADLAARVTTFANRRQMSLSRVVELFFKLGVEEFESKNGRIGPEETHAE